MNAGKKRKGMRGKDILHITYLVRYDPAGTRISPGWNETTAERTCKKGSDKEKQHAHAHATVRVKTRRAGQKKEDM